MIFPISGLEFVQRAVRAQIFHRFVHESFEAIGVLEFSAKGIRHVIRALRHDENCVFATLAKLLDQFVFRQRAGTRCDSSRENESTKSTLSVARKFFGMKIATSEFGNVRPRKKTGRDICGLRAGRMRKRRGNKRRDHQSSQWRIIASHVSSARTPTWRNR